MGLPHAGSSALAESALAALRLPLSGLAVRVAPPTGREDLILVEEASSPLEVALQYLQRVVRSEEGSVPDLCALTLHDFDVLIMRLRAALLGDRIETDAACPAASCARRMDISFGIGQYLAHHRPAPPPWKQRHWQAWASDTEAGWFHLRRQADGDEVCRFRLPTVRDVIELQTTGLRASRVVERCVRPGRLAARDQHRVEAAMQIIAPSLSSDLQGRCPECGALVHVAWEPRRYCMAEFRQHARFIMEDVDLLAQRYHWSEGDILAIPNRRRLAYAEIARQPRGTH